MNIRRWSNIKIYYIITLSIFISLTIGYFLAKYIAKVKISSAEISAKNIIENAEREANSLKKEKELQAKEEAYNIMRDVEVEIKQKRVEMQRLESSLINRSNSLVQKIESL